MPAANDDTLELEVFRAGDYGPKGRFDEAALDAIAADYDPSRHEAPVTLDHLQDGPADGWVSRLRRVGDRLVAALSRLSPRLREAIAAGAYKKRSVELYRALRSTGRPYLKAVSFLGAAAPEVKGLADPVFAGGEPALRFDEDHDPARAAAEDARARLVAARRWHPEWEERGLLAAFEHLGPGARLEAVVAVLSEQEEPVAFGAVARGEAGADAFHGSATPGSVRAHERAIEYLAHHPHVSYREALLRSAV